VSVYRGHPSSRKEYWSLFNEFLLKRSITKYKVYITSENVPLNQQRLMKIKFQCSGDIAEW